MLPLYYTESHEYISKYGSLRKKWMGFLGSKISALWNGHAPPSNNKQPLEHQSHYFKTRMNHARLSSRTSFTSLSSIVSWNPRDSHLAASDSRQSWLPSVCCQKRPWRSIVRHRLDRKIDLINFNAAQGDRMCDLYVDRLKEHPILPYAKAPLSSQWLPQL